jgi:type II secretory pathway pseudopilin PulG
MTGKDIFYVVAQEPGSSAVMVSPETAATQIPTILAQYNPQNPNQYAYPLAGVSSLLDWFAKDNSSGNGRAQAIVVMSGTMLTDRKYTLAAVAAKANAMGIPVHTVQFRHSMGQQETLEQLADETGGQFFYYGYEGATSLAGLKPLLTGIRTQYILTYRSPNSESGTRIVSVNFQYANKPALSQYDITVEPPVGVIRSPGEDQTIRPQSYTPTEDPKATPVTGIVVTASVSWPDGHPRKIQSATLLVNGKPQAVLTAPTDELTFVWIPAKDFTPGPATLQIQIADELGLIGLSDQIVVRIEAASPFTFDLSMNNVLAILAVLLAATAVVLVVVFRKQVAGTAQQAVGAASDFMQEVGETLRFKNRPTTAKAILVDLDGTSGTGKSDIELYGTTSIGRSQKNADLVFQANQPESPISRLHCTFLEEDGAFFLRDDQSANGTYLNGVRLAPLERNPLKDGDEIRLANPEKKGVRLQFRAQGGGSASGGADTESTNRMSL